MEAVATTVAARVVAAKAAARAGWRAGRGWRRRGRGCATPLLEARAVEARAVEARVVVASCACVRLQYSCYSYYRDSYSSSYSELLPSTTIWLCSERKNSVSSRLSNELMNA